jgi:hypothetical protein
MEKEGEVTDLRQPMPISADIRIDVLLARFRAERARTAPSRLPTGGGASGGDRVEISASGSLNVRAVNGILNDSVVEQVNRAIQEAGIDLTVEGALQIRAETPEATARRIADYATGYRDDYDGSHSAKGSDARIAGFMSLIRGAIEEGFTHARDFLKSINGLTDAVNQNIDRTFELTNRYLDAFQAALAEEAATPDDASDTGPTPMGSEAIDGGKEGT